MIGVEEAQSRLLALASPLPAIEVSIEQAIGHYLAEDVVAKRTQPATDLSAMDGYAIRFGDLPGPWTLIGESAAGRPFGGQVGAGEAARIFTGAHVPHGADCILVQEEASHAGALLTLSGEGPPRVGAHIRRKGGDFSEGDRLLKAGTRLNAGVISAAVMAGYGTLAVGGRPRISIIASGDELLPPGQICDSNHIPSSNSVMLAAMLAGVPCIVDNRGIVADNLTDLEAALRACEGSDIIVTSGGASVGDHDLIQPALRNVGAKIDFWKVAMRPGKPVMAGRLGRSVVLGLPGNPSSAFVTAFLFLLPLVRHLTGCKEPLPRVFAAPLGCDLPAGGTRTDYFRAKLVNGVISIFNRQDSAMLSPLSQANALLINPANASARSAGSPAQYLPLE
jgi:molybdopterin molybdotransferase